ncbi:family 16 glycosylhydrolase [Phaeodactylibacter xiamenensis]|uniref:family 16 glycosylhydrolase n=1 Tax=Phaeodactylibacter xiamenensis TaxID=1524460 RepID=UPI003CCC08E8
MDRIIRFLLFSCLLTSIPAQIQAQPCMELIWADEFDGTALDTNNWSYDLGDGCPDLCGWGNNEWQFYTDAPENIKVENGLLVITGREDSTAFSDFTSAKIISQGKADFRYGRFEARMRLPQGQGVWPAFWMLPTESVYGIWPRSGEMDIMEMIGTNPGQLVGTVHTGMPYDYESGYYDLPAGQILADNFHVYAMEWEPDSITWFIDGIQYHQLTPDDIGPWAPFQEDFYLIINLALGGNWPGDVDPAVLPQTLEVDYVRVYNRPDRIRIEGQQPTVEAAGRSYQAPDIAGANYNWIVPADATITSGQGTHAITVDWGCTPGDVSLELQTPCDSANLVYTVPDFVTPTLSGPETVTENQMGITYAFPQASAGAFTWEVPASASIVSGQDGNEIVVDWGCDPGEVVVAFNSTCGETFSDTLTVALRTYPMSGQSYVPPNTNNQTYSIEEDAGDTFTWSIPADASILSGQGTPSIQVDFGTSSGLISVAVATSCGTKTYELPVDITESYLYVDFDTRDLEFVPHNDAVFEEVPNPSPSGINMSDSVGLVYKPAIAPRWAGVEADVPEIPLDLYPVMTRKVFCSDTGAVSFMLDDVDLPPGVDRYRIFVEYGPEDVNTWVQLVFDFSGRPGGVYERLRFTHNHWGPSYTSDTEYWYFDDVMAWSDLSTSTSAEVGITETITVYPNPSLDWFYVETKDIFPVGSTYDLEVLDVQGRSVLRREVFAEGQPVALDLSTQPAGLYFVRLSGQSLRYVKAISKME